MNLPFDTVMGPDSENHPPALTEDAEPKRWYVMRDLKRHNAKMPAFKELAMKGIEVFTPLKSRLSVCGGKRIREEIPVIQGLLFVHESRGILDPVVEKTPTLQYRFVRGGFREPMTVRDADMERFIYAVRAAESPVFYVPDELTPQMCGKKVRMVGGNLDGYEGRLLAVRGSRVKRILIELPNLLSVSVEVQPEYIQLIN